MAFPFHFKSLWLNGLSCLLSKRSESDFETMPCPLIVTSESENDLSLTLLKLTRDQDVLSTIRLRTVFLPWVTARESATAIVAIPGSASGTSNALTTVYTQGASLSY